MERWPWFIAAILLLVFIPNATGQSSTKPVCRFNALNGTAGTTSASDEKGDRGFFESVAWMAGLGAGATVLSALRFGPYVTIFVLGAGTWGTTRAVMWTPPSSSSSSESSQSYASIKSELLAPACSYEFTVGDLGSEMEAIISPCIYVNSSAPLNAVITLIPSGVGLTFEPPQLVFGLGETSKCLHIRCLGGYAPGLLWTSFSFLQIPSNWSGTPPQSSLFRCLSSTVSFSQSSTGSVAQMTGPSDASDTSTGDSHSPPPISTAGLIATASTSGTVPITGVAAGSSGSDMAATTSGSNLTADAITADAVTVTSSGSGIVDAITADAVTATSSGSGIVDTITADAITATSSGSGIVATTTGTDMTGSATASSTCLSSTASNPLQANYFTATAAIFSTNQSATPGWCHEYPSRQWVPWCVLKRCFWRIVAQSSPSNFGVGTYPLQANFTNTDAILSALATLSAQTDAEALEDGSVDWSDPGGGRLTSSTLALAITIALDASGRASCSRRLSWAGGDLASPFSDLHYHAKDTMDSQFHGLSTGDLLSIANFALGNINPVSIPSSTCPSRLAGVLTMSLDELASVLERVTSAFDVQTGAPSGALS